MHAHPAHQGILFFLNGAGDFWSATSTTAKR